jgi:Bacterial PH domain
MESIRFRSRVDIWLVVLIFGTGIGSLIHLAYKLRVTGDSRLYTPFLIVIVSMAPLVWMFTQLSYIITDRELQVRGSIIRSTIPLSTVRSIRPSSSILSAPALSMTRIEVIYGSGNSVVISPKDEARFLETMQARVPGLVIERRMAKAT